MFIHFPERAVKHSCNGNIVLVFITIPAPKYTLVLKCYHSLKFIIPKSTVYVKFDINLITTVLEVQAELQTAFSDTVLSCTKFQWSWKFKNSWTSAKNDEWDNHPSGSKYAATLKHVQNFNIVHIVHHVLHYPFLYQLSCSTPRFITHILVLGPMHFCLY